jgi:hypothetical protein
MSASVGRLWPVEFESELWIWSAKDGQADSWVFATVPEHVSDEIRDLAGPPRGFGSVRVEATIGATTWRTSVFPNSAAAGTFALPLKKAVRKAEGLEVGDSTTIELRVVDG